MHSGLLDKFFLTLRTSNGNLSFSFRNTHRLSAFWAVIIPVGFVLKPVQKHQIPAVFLIPLIGITGKRAEDRQDHQRVSQQRQNQLQNGVSKKHGKQHDRAADPQQCRIQLIRTIATLHKAAKTRPDFLTCMPKPRCKAIHDSITRLHMIAILYFKNKLFQHSIGNVNGLFTGTLYFMRFLFGF